MSIRFLFTTVFCALAAAAFAADAPKGGDPKKAPPPKTPADLAWDNFDKIRKEQGPRDQARFNKVIAAGIDYIVKNPTHSRINSAVVELAFWGNNNIDAKQPALRTSYLSNLRLAVTNERFKDGVSEPAVAALHAVEAASADAEVRFGQTMPLLVALREKLDELATVPQTGRFQEERERSYVHLFTLFNQPPYAKVEEHLNKMLKHSNKSVADMAQRELNIIQARKAPYDLKFTAMDGKEVDFAQLRGKVVALYFWQSTNRGSVQAFENLLRVASDYRRKGVELVTVSFDKPEDEAKLKAAIKEAGLKAPVHFDGKGAKNAFAPKLNVTGVPALLVFDQKGMLLATMQGLNLTINLPTNQFEPTVKRLTDPPAKK